MKIILKFFAISLISIFFNSSVLAKPKIVTSISPIGSIAANLLDNNSADIEVIFSNSGCPHDYHGRPSDLTKIQNADLVIYIDDHFDSFFAKLVKNHQGTTLKISAIKTMNFTNNQGENNWHFWLDINNVIALEKELTKFFIEKFPELKTTILANSKKLKQKLYALETEKSELVNKLGKIILLSDSLEHLFNQADETSNITKFYQNNSHNSSLKSLGNLMHNSQEIAPRCILIDMEQDVKTYSRLGAKIVQIDSDNWHIENNLTNLFFIKFENILKSLEKCR